MSVSRTILSFTVPTVLGDWVREQSSKYNMTVSRYLALLIEQANASAPPLNPAIEAKRELADRFERSKLRALPPPRMPIPRRHPNKKKHAEFAAQYKIDRAKYEADLAAYNASKI